MAVEGLQDCNGTSKGDHFNHTITSLLYDISYWHLVSKALKTITACQNFHLS